MIGRAGQWLIAGAISVVAHAALFAVLAISTEPDPVAQQEVAQSRLDIATHEVESRDAPAQPAVGEKASEAEAAAATVSGTGIPVGRAEALAVPDSAVPAVVAAGESAPPVPANAAAERAESVRAGTQTLAPVRDAEARIAPADLAAEGEVALGASAPIPSPAAPVAPVAATLAASDVAVAEATPRDPAAGAAVAAEAAAAVQALASERAEMQALEGAEMVAEPARPAAAAVVQAAAFRPAPTTGARLRIAARAAVARPPGGRADRLASARPRVEAAVFRPPPAIAAPARAPDAELVALRAPEAALAALRAPDAPALAQRTPDAATLAERRPDAATLAERRPDAATLAERRPNAATLAERRPDAATLAERRPDAATLAVRPPDAPALAQRTPDAAALALRAPDAAALAERAPDAVPATARPAEAPRADAPEVPAAPGERLALDAAPAAGRRPGELAEAPPVSTPPGERATAALAWNGEDDAPLDPVSVAAIQAFMRPGDLASADASAGRFRDQIEAFLAAVPCARLQTTFVPETGRLELRGHIPEEGLRAPVLEALQGQVGGAIPVADNLLILPRPQCGALSGIGQVGLPQSTDQLRNPRVVGPDAHARVYEFTEGQRLEFDLVGPDYDAVFYIDYYDADGMVLHLQPNEYLPLEPVLAKAALTVGAARDDGPSLNITVAPPFGQEIMVAMATTRPLYDGLRPIREPAEPYLDFMRRQVTEARAADPDFKGEWVYFFVRTMPE